MKTKIMSKNCFAGPEPPVLVSRVQALLGLIDRGSYGPRLERFVLAAIAAAGVGERMFLESPHIFSALMCARKYHEAFRLGEVLLDKFGFVPSPQHLRWPWWRKKGRALFEETFRADELSRIRAAGRRGGFPHWFAYYRVILLGDRGGERAMAEYERIKPLDLRRYSWMHAPFVTVKLGMLDFDGAIEICRKVLAATPSYWEVRCRLAEAYLIKDERNKALREFELAEGAADHDSRREVLAWHGEALLWLGEYDSALKKLDEAVFAGAQAYVYGWRGAARLKLDAAARALADLDYAVALDPEDFEARCWRGEAHRLSGRGAEAAADLDYVIRHAPYNYWAYINRALLKGSAGDARAMAADAAEIPKEVLRFEAVKRGSPRAAATSAAAMRRILEAVLDRAKGVRRWERYVQNIWMNPA